MLATLSSEGKRGTECRLPGKQANAANSSLVDAEKNMSCASCGALDPTKTCSACTCVHYCGEKCQRAHWPKHKAVCKRFAEHKATCKEPRMEDGIAARGFVPAKCNLCAAPIIDVFYDAVTTNGGMWACMCPACFRFGPGAGVLGVGSGQK